MAIKPSVNADPALESLILRGIFKDEHRTDQGGCTMLIREGDLVW